MVSILAKPQCGQVRTDSRTIFDIPSACQTKMDSDLWNRGRIASVPRYGNKGGCGMAEELSIGPLARTAGVNVETIRYYQRRGLLEEPVRPSRGRRRYSDDAVRRVRFIKRAQRLGFTLDEIKSLLKLEDGRSCRETRLLAEQKLMLIEQRLADLSRVRRLLKGLIRECDRGRPPRPCPIIAALSVSDENSR